MFIEPKIGLGQAVHKNIQKQKNLITDNGELLYIIIQ